MFLLVFLLRPGFGHSRAIAALFQGNTVDEHALDNALALLHADAGDDVIFFADIVDPVGQLRRNAVSVEGDLELDYAVLKRYDDADAPSTFIRPLASWEIWTYIFSPSSGADSSIHVVVSSGNTTRT